MSTFSSDFSFFFPIFHFFLISFTNSFHSHHYNYYYLSSLLGAVPAVRAVVFNLGHAVKTLGAAGALEAAAVPGRAHRTLDLLRHEHCLLAARALVTRAKAGGLLAKLSPVEAPLLLLARDRVDGEARGVVAMSDCGC